MRTDEKETIIIIQQEPDGAWTRIGSDKGLNSVYMLKIQAVGFAGGLDIGTEQERGARMIPKYWFEQL